MIRWVPLWVWVITGVAVTARVAAPSLGLRYLNYKLLHGLGPYEARVQNLDLGLIRLAIQLKGITVRERNPHGKKSDLPLMRARHVEFAWSWRNLFAGNLSAQVRVNGLHWNLIVSDAPPSSPQPPSKSPNLARFVPVGRLLISDSSIDIRYADQPQHVALALDEIEGEGLGGKVQKPQIPEPFRLQARVQKTGVFQAEGVMGLQEHFLLDADFILKDFQPQTINPLLRHYIPLDFREGTVNLYGEVASSRGAAIGYVKVFLHHAVVIESKQKVTSSHSFLANFISSLAFRRLKNQTVKDLATELPFRVRHGTIEVDGMKAFGKAVKNTTSQLKPQIDHKISLENFSK